MNDEAENDNSKMIEFRLSSIENTLAEMKNLLISVKLQEKDINSLKNQETEFLNAINAHEKRIKALEIKPDKENAAKWEFIADSIFKVIVIGIIYYGLNKIGIPVH